MKLFALAATTVTARSSRTPGRVTDPAPGFINEQGGYWADQPTHPQAPQPDYQARQIHYQQPQKPQCCQGYYWTSPTNEQVWLEKSGEWDSKPFYKGWDNKGVERVLFWGLDDVSFSPVVEAIPGHWYFSTSVGDMDNAITESRESYGLRYCPQDYQSQPFTNDMNFSCGQAPQRQHPNPTQCCNEFTWNTGAEDVTMRISGWHSQRHTYSGTDTSGKQFVLYWKFDSVSDNRPVQAVPGYWYLGTDTNNGEKIHTKAAFGLKSCPSNLNIGLTLDLKCKVPPPPPPQQFLTCADKRKQMEDNRDFSIFVKTAEMDECHIAKIMEQLVQQQLQQFVNKFRSDAHTLWKHFSDAVNAWKNLTGIDQGTQRDRCGFQNNPRIRETGFVTNCDDLCAEIKELESENDFADVMNEFANFAVKEFDEGKLQLLLISNSYC